MLAKIKYYTLHIKVFLQPKDHLRKKTGLKIKLGKNIRVPAWTKNKTKNKDLSVCCTQSEILLDDRLLVNWSKKNKTTTSGEIFT